MMKSLETMLQTWVNSATVMHIAHHAAATRFEGLNIWLGSCLGAALTALVGTTGFAALADSPLPWAAPAAFAVSALVAALGAVNVRMDYRGRAQRQHAAATAFQGLRREMEEDLVRLRQGDVRPSYNHLRDRWTRALDAAPRLPRGLHRQVRAEVTRTEIAAAEQGERDICLEWPHRL